MDGRDNEALNQYIEERIRLWSGSAHGQIIKNMYENGTSYIGICAYLGIDPEEWGVTE